MSTLIKLWPYQDRVISRYLISVSDIVRSNLIVGWKLLKAVKNPSKSKVGTMVLSSSRWGTMVLS